MSIYFDNAATTPLDPEVWQAMQPYLTRHFGNPSSRHSLGREAHRAVEQARRTIADLLNASPNEIFFTSGATEADNLAITGTLRTQNTRHAITSPIEHHAVLNCLLDHVEKGRLQLSLLKLNANGNLDLDDLEILLQQHPGSLVSLMHANNEVGNLNNLEAIGQLCRKYRAVFHSDTVHTLGTYAFDLRKCPVDLLVGSGHKLHGPKGIGLLFKRDYLKLEGFFLGGPQEQNLRPGTENVAGIVGLAKALEMSQGHLRANQMHIRNLKRRLILGLREILPDIKFNGDSATIERSIHGILNVSFPGVSLAHGLLEELDRRGIAASGGSACSSHSAGGSHVLQALRIQQSRENIRFSFSRFNSEAELDFLLMQISDIYCRTQGVSNKRPTTLQHAPT